MNTGTTAMGLTRILKTMAVMWGGGLLRTVWKTRRLQVGFLWSRHRRRRALEREELLVPMAIALSPTMRCNLACRGCYARFHPTDGEMPLETIESLIGEAAGLGVFLFVVTGGEPYLRTEMIDLYEKYRDVLFLTVTNGTLIDGELAARLAAAGNVLPVVSIEGTREQTDARRGAGVYDRATECMRLLRRSRIPFGFSAIVTTETADTLGSEGFIAAMTDLGCTIGFYNEFVPMDPDEIGLVPDTERRLRFAERVDRLRRAFPILLVNLPADEYDESGRCMAVASGAVHVTAPGDVEPCPFAHFARENVGRSSFRDILRSPFLAALRGHPTALQCGEIGCSLVSNRAILEEIARETGAHPTDVLPPE